MCRAPVVLLADRCEDNPVFRLFLRTNHSQPSTANVDWALQNFLQDWFPVETKVKRKNNEREAGEEELREMGFGERTCTIA
jgi:hypothetical protein